MKVWVYDSVKIMFVVGSMLPKQLSKLIQLPSLNVLATSGPPSSGRKSWFQS